MAGHGSMGVAAGHESAARRSSANLSGGFGVLSRLHSGFESSNAMDLPCSNVRRAHKFLVAYFVARMTGAAEIDVLNLTSYGAKVVAISESAAAEAEAFEAEE